MTGLTTHVLDLTSGKPADELNISFYIKKPDRKALIADFVTNADGRLDKPIFDKIRESLKMNNIKYLDEPYTRFKDKKEQQETFFIKDPHGNILELKTLTN